MLEAKRVRGNERITNSLFFFLMGIQKEMVIQSKLQSHRIQDKEEAAMSHCSVPRRPGQNIHISHINLMLLKPVRDHIYTQKLHHKASTPKAIGEINSHKG